ncbi:hypothetical protein [Sorangium sp. So ce1182]|uniref:hypothetical protein n=1 Tax=Sorangium sp. So ce1182 TaxID=3133334 RepID=UPI003F61F7E9
MGSSRHGRPGTCRKAKTPTAAAYPASERTSVVFAENRRMSAPIGSKNTTLLSAP